MDNLKDKMVEWFECHPTALEDLSNFCGRKSKRMLNEMNKDINKVYVGDTSFSVIKRDYEKNIAVLQNDISKIYNVAKGIYSNNQGWEFSLIYTSIKEEAICCYIENTNNDIDLIFQYLCQHERCDWLEDHCHTGKSCFYNNTCAVTFVQKCGTANKKSTDQAGQDNGFYCIDSHGLCNLFTAAQGTDGKSNGCPIVNNISNN